MSSSHWNAHPPRALEAHLRADRAVICSYSDSRLFKTAFFSLKSLFYFRTKLYFLFYKRAAETDVMEIRTILFVILNAHTCTAIFNVSAEDSLAENTTIVQPAYPQDLHEKPRNGPSGRSFHIQHHYETQTYEPIDFNMDETSPDSYLFPNETRKGRVTETRQQASLSNKGGHPCNVTDLNGTKCNQTLVLILKISKEAVDFLKGPVVTRIMPSFYIIIILISLPLNALALVTFTCKIREKKPAVIYMSHLACVDLLFTLLLPLKIHYQLNASDWVFGEAVCRVISAAYYCYMYCSILLMMCISVDRLLAVVFPVASLTWRKARNASFICTLVWLLAIAGTVPLLSVKQTFKIKHVGVTCHDALIHDDPTDQLYMYLFFILSCLYYFVPLIVTLVSYSIIIYALRTKSNQFTKSSSLSDKKRRAVIMAIVVLMVFVMCFAPTNGILLYHCVQLAQMNSRKEDSSYVATIPEINTKMGDSSYAAYLLAVCLGSVSVFLDPLLYYYGSSQSRQKIKSVFWWRLGKTTLSNSNTETKSSFVSCEYSQAHVKVGIVST
ncbi:proteinase-activated receptor 1-like isoform X1 [Carassius auratus]|uniref:Proteinase-activated receptor 1 n=1 Tax=Carassius auratus TaxID=7957 RepID=A0A6P6M4U7_CARAU|nr:proteinase-activated receptor 1-like isoform X1 [Carassius auratus]